MLSSICKPFFYQKVGTFVWIRVIFWHKEVSAEKNKE